MLKNKYPIKVAKQEKIRIFALVKKRHNGFKSVCYGYK